jgi:SAM-dependent methyltransferase
MKPLIRWLKNVASSCASGVLVDFGCGNKPYHSFFQSRVTQYIGVDLIQNESGTVDIVLENSLSLPLEANSVDCVLSTQVLEHVPEPEEYLKEVSRVLKPRGRLLLSCPGSYMLHEEPHDYYRYTSYGLQLLLEKCNLKVVHIDTAGGAWRLMGQVFLNHRTFGRRWSIPLFSGLLYYASVVLANLVFSVLDRLNSNTKDTANYMVVAEK